MLLNTVHMKGTCFIFLSTWGQEASGSPLWTLIGWLVVTNAALLEFSLLLGPKRLTKGSQWCDHLLGLSRVFPSCTDHLWGKREKYIEKRVISTENIFLSLNSSICFSVKLEWLFFPQRKQKTYNCFPALHQHQVDTKSSSVCSTLLLVFQLRH